MFLSSKNSGLDKVILNPNKPELEPKLESKLEPKLESKLEQEPENLN
jgi:hypothetical protein